jgi:5-methylcytosine-specific restriction endonuclease McrA
MDKSDADEIAELVKALQSMEIADSHLADLRRLYQSPDGFPYTVDKKNAPQAETIGSCRKVGSHIKKALGITSALPYGMNLVGFCDVEASTWKMHHNFRISMDLAGLISATSDSYEPAVKAVAPTYTFELWLRNEGKSEKTASNYAGAVAGRLKTLAAQISKPSFSASNIATANSFESFCEVHDDGGEVKALNIRGKDMYRRALVWYSKFLASQVTTVSLRDVEQQLREQVSKSLRDTKATRAKRLAKAGRIPSTITVTSTVYDRNPDVVAEAFLEANGHCQGCGCKAPFVRRSDNSPYLEVHHRMPLANGGEDTVANAIALCPNCHREMHYGTKAL